MSAATLAEARARHDGDLVLLQQPDGEFLLGEPGRGDIRERVERTARHVAGEAGGIEAASADHEVIMTPNSYVYFDHAQVKKEDSLVIGGYLPLDKVYNYEPIPKELPAGKEKYILGAQANVWSEYMANTAKVEYMVFPRASALSEVLWSQKGKRDWKTFQQKLPVMVTRYEQWGINYSKAYLEY